ncbi:MAG TPA: Ig-like domain repeat protein, partial [Pyrinomonadaceae bacterium]|nr:Ig-like domain repeat protein [Pyrinomonadaceae bacterium]
MPFVQITLASSGAQRQIGNHSSGSRVTIATEKQSYRTNPNAAVPAPAPQPLVPSITATKVDALIADDGDNKADPGGTEKIEYTITITNNGTDASNVVFTDEIDAHTTLVNGSINTQPIADPDTYTASGNIAIAISAPGVLANDRDPDTGNNSGLTVTKVQGTAANVGVATDTTATGRGGVKGKVTLAADGGFSYEPAPGFVGDDTFTYETSDGTKIDTAEVKITITNMVWFISNNAGGLNLGTFSNPFTSIASFNTANAGTGVAPDPKNGDFISLRTGTGTYNETDGINLRTQQRLIGNAIQFNTVFTAAANSIAAYNTFASAAGAAPTISTSGGNGVDLATDNIVRGLNVGNVGGSFAKINGTTVGNLVLNTVSASGNGAALNVSTSGAFGSNVTFDTLSSASAIGVANVNLVNVTGTLAVTSGGAGLTNNIALPLVNVSGGNVNFSYPGSVARSGGTGTLVSVSGGHTGTLAFVSVNGSTGGGLSFDNADGSYSFNTAFSLTGGTAGISITNGSSGTFNWAAVATISGIAGVPLNVGTSPGNPNVTYSGSITHNNGGTRAVNIDGTTGGSIGINSVTAGSVAGGVGNTGININNANGSVAITTLNLGTSGTRMTSTAVTIAGGSGAKTFNTISIFTTGAAQGVVSTTTTGAITIGDGTVDTAGAPAFNLAGTSNGIRTPLNIQLDTVNTNGGSAGIVLANTSATGSPGGFRILGTGGTCTNASTAGCSGGQIQNTTGSDSTTASAGSGIHMTNVDSVVFTRMHIHDHSNYGIRGVNVSNFTLNTSVLRGVNGNNPGGPFSEGSIVFDGTGAAPAQGLTGSSSIINSDVRGGRSDNLRIDNDAGTLNLTVSGSTFRDTTDAADANDNIFIELGQTAIGFVSITGSTFGETSGDHIQGNLVNTAVGHFTITGNTFTGVGSAKPSTRFGMGILIAGGTWTGTCRYNISNNIMSGTRQGHAIHTNKGGPTGGTMEGTISGNTIGVGGTPDSGAAESSGITVASRGSSGSHVAVVSNNNIHQTDEFGINLEVGEDNGAAVTSTASSLAVTVTGNTIDTPGVNALHGIHLNSGILPTDNPTACADIGGVTAALRNNVTNAANEAGGGSDIRPRQRQASRVELPGYAGGPFDNAAVNAYITGRNNLTTVAASNNNDAGTANDGFHNTPGGAPCAQPAAPTVPTGPLTSEDGGSAAVNGAGVRSDVASVPASVNSAPARATQPSLHAQVMKQPAHVATQTAASNTGRQKLAVKTADNRSRKTNSHHPTLRSRALMAAAMSGETVTRTIGTLRAGDSVTITFQVTVDNPPNLTLLNPPRVSNQGSVAYNDGATPQTPVLTDDPAVGGANDPTETPVDLFDTTTTLVSDINPSDFGETVTFTATVAENPAQGSADPAGTVDFIDTSNGNAVICDDVALTGGIAECQTSTLTAGTHNIRADYSGDGNFDPSQSNIVEQVVNACTQNPVVTTTADAGAGSLREALANVCAGDTITFNIPDAGPHTITLTSGELLVDQDVIINNNSGESITVSGNNLSRVFHVDSGKTAAIIGLTISGGNTTGDGGGILNDGALTVVNSTLSGNVAGADGGGISTSATSTSLTLINTTISGNSAGGSGGGVIVLAGTATIVNTTITNNTADSDNNAAGAGGGIRAHAGTTTLKNTIVAGNFNEDGATDSADDISGTVDAAS